MKVSTESARDTSSITPRRRGQSEPALRQSPSSETFPVLLRLPDLHPSQAMDAAVERIERFSSGQKKSTSPRRGNPSGTTRVSSQPPSTPSLHSKLTTAQWNNRIIVATFVFTLVASGFMVVQRQLRGPADRDRSNTDFSSAYDVEPDPSRRIDRQSFQADSRAADIGESDRRQSANQGNQSTARIDAYSESNAEFPTVPVSYESQFPAGHSSTPSALNGPTYDMSGNAGHDDPDMYQPRSLRLHGESF